MASDKTYTQSKIDVSGSNETMENALASNSGIHSKHDSLLAAKKNGACSSRQIHGNSPQTYTESGQDGGKKIPLYVFCLLRIFRRCLDGGGG